MTTDMQHWLDMQYVSGSMTAAEALELYPSWLHPCLVILTADEATL